LIKFDEFSSIILIKFIKNSSTIVLFAHHMNCEVR